MLSGGNDGCGGAAARGAGVLEETDGAADVAGGAPPCEVEDGPETAPERAPIVVPPGPATLGSSALSSSMFLGISASPRNGTSTPWMTSLSLDRSMHAW
jgi:hypothetical protein